MHPLPHSPIALSVTQLIRAVCSWYPPVTSSSSSPTPSGAAPVNSFATICCCSLCLVVSAILLKNQGNLFIDVFRHQVKGTASGKWGKGTGAQGATPICLATCDVSCACGVCSNKAHSVQSFRLQLFLCVPRVRRHDVIAPVCDSCCSCCARFSACHVLCACSFEAEYLS